MAHAESIPSPSYRRSPGGSAGQAQAGVTNWLDAALQGTSVPPLVLVIGLGDGSLLDVLEARAPSAKVLALEPDPSVAAACRARPIAQRWLASGRLVHLVDPDYSGSDRAWRMFDGVAAHAVLTHPDLRIEAESAVRAARALKNIVFGARANAAARRRFAPRYLVNALRNVPAMLRGRDVQALADAYRGVPAVITAAGPSLDGAIEDLRGVSDRALLIATDTSLRPLLHAGIVPPLVVALDPGAANARHFQSLPDCSDTWLVSELALDRHAAAVFGERVFWFRAGDHQPWPLLAELGIEAARLDVWGSVLTGAYQVACLAGCDPIVFVGADLAYTDGRPYARGTTYEFDWAWHTGQGMELEDVWREQIARRELQTDTDLRGAAAMTTTSLLSFRDWLLARARQRPTRIVNATGAGMLFGEGIEQRTLSEMLSSPAGMRPLSEMPRHGTPRRPSAVATRLRRLGMAVRAGDRSAPIDAWATFSGEGFDPAAVSAALDEAARAIETKRTDQVAPTLVDWSDDRIRTITTDVMRTLPESLRRFGNLLRTATPAATPGPSVAKDADTRLLLALDLLSAVASHSLRADDLFQVAAPSGPVASPVSALFHWPEQLRWAIQVFESILSGTVCSLRDLTGSAGHAGTGGHDDSYHGAAHDPRPHTSFALLQLALQWLRCADAAADSPLPGIADIVCLAPHAPTHATGPEADTLLIAGGGRTLSIPLCRDARVRLGGDGCAQTDAPLPIGSFTLHKTGVVIALGAPGAARRAGRAGHYRAVS